MEARVELDPYPPSAPLSNVFCRGAESAVQAACHVIFGQAARKSVGCGGWVLSMAAAMREHRDTD